MKVIGKFILLDIAEFKGWLNMQTINREGGIKIIQQHHTYIPSYAKFNGSNHFQLCESMERAHLERGFAEIAQNITTFPDGMLMICRNFNTMPAGIKGANTNGICIENVGNFDLNRDLMTVKQRECIISVTKALLARFNLIPNENTVVYHHWYDLTLGKRIKIEGTGNTKTCPGTNFFGGNTIAAFRANFLPHLL